MAAAFDFRGGVFPGVGGVVFAFGFGAEVGSAAVLAEEDEVCAGCDGGFEGG